MNIKQFDREEYWQLMIVALELIAKEKNITQAYICKKLKVAPNLISDFFLLKHCPRLSTFAKIASVVGAGVVIDKTEVYEDWENIIKVTWAIIEKKGLSTLDIANKANISRTNVVRYKKLDICPLMNTFIAIVMAIDVDLQVIDEKTGKSILLKKILHRKAEIDEEKNHNFYLGKHRLTKKDFSEENRWKVMVFPLKLIAMEKGIKQKEIAKTTEIDQGNVSRVLLLKHQPTMETYINISKAIDINFTIENKIFLTHNYEVKNCWHLMVSELKTIAKEKNITLIDIANKIGCDTSIVSICFGFKSCPMLSTFIAISKAVGVKFSITNIDEYPKTKSILSKMIKNLTHDRTS